jgi:hypothetical protein
VEEDRFIIVTVAAEGYGNWANLQMAIRAAPQFRFGTPPLLLSPFLLYPLHYLLIYRSIWSVLSPFVVCTQTDWFFKSRSSLDLQRRCDYLIRLLDKESGDGTATGAKRKKKEPSETKASGKKAAKDKSEGEGKASSKKEKEKEGKKKSSKAAAAAEEEEEEDAKAESEEDEKPLGEKLKSKSKSKSKSKAEKDADTPKAKGKVRALLRSTASCLLTTVCVRRNGRLRKQRTNKRFRFCPNSSLTILGFGATYSWFLTLANCPRAELANAREQRRNTVFARGSVSCGSDSRFVIWQR